MNEKSNNMMHNYNNENSEEAKEDEIAVELPVEVPLPSWTAKKVANWFIIKGLDTKTAQNFIRHKITGDVLFLLDKSDLKSMGINLVGDQLLIIHLLRRNNPNSSTSSRDYNNDKLSSYTSIVNDENCYFNNTDYNSRGRTSSIKKTTRYATQLDPAFLKLTISFIYAFLVFGLTSFVMVVVHQRLPDMTKYPPLPDIILDNIPLIPWAFEAAEGVGVILFVLWLVVLLLHKHRFILMRRFFSIAGTVFLLRCITMFITSLSVPGRHLHASCSKTRFNTIQEKVERALEIWLGFGMSINGVKTCGDYMFSGHTTSLTLLNFFITEYTPRRFHTLHTFTWLLNMFGIFFILAAHEHYSIDVFVAFYISSRLFLYYHWMANNKALLKHDRDRARLWFPLFNYFESECDGIVPCHLDFPSFHFNAFFHKSE